MQTALPASLALSFGMAAMLALPAAAQPISPLAGTWIAVDDGFPRLVAAGLLLPSEEILRIAADGSAQSQIMTTTGRETHFMCATGWGCSDMLPVQEAKAEVNGGSLIFVNRQPTAESTKITQQTQLLAAGLTLIATSPQWVVSLEAGGTRARFESGNMTRHFARIDPERLNKLRGALDPLEVSYTDHWRCFLSNATAGDPAFDRLGGPRQKPGAWFEDYLTASAQYHRLDLLTNSPVPGDPIGAHDPLWAKSAGVQVTHSMLGPDVKWPASLAERMKYRAPLLAISAIARHNDEAMGLQAARQLDPAYAGDTGISSAGLAAMRKVMQREASQDAEVRGVFCLDLKDAPPPRPGLDPFRDVKLPK